MEPQAAINPNRSTRERTYREIGVILLAMPIPLYPVVSLWVYADDGWVITRHAYPELREGFVLLFLQLLMVSLTAITTFLGLLMLYFGQYRRCLTGWLLLLSALPCVLGVIVVCFSVYSYFLFAE